MLVCLTRLWRIILCTSRIWCSLHWLTHSQTSSLRYFHTFLMICTNQLLIVSFRSVHKEKVNVSECLFKTHKYSETYCILILWLCLDYNLCKIYFLFRNAAKEVNPAGQQLWRSTFATATRVCRSRRSTFCRHSKRNWCPVNHSQSSVMQLVWRHVISIISVAILLLCCSKIILSHYH